MVTGLGFAILFVAFLTALWMIPRIREWAFSQGWVDEPDGERKLHTNATPAMGGLAIAGGAAVGFVLLYAAAPVLGVATLSPLFWIGALVMVGVGFYDDVRGLGAKRKFIVQLGVAYLLLHAGYRLDLSGLPYFETLGGYDLALYSVPLTLLWIVGIINAVNLIDGLDGLAGGIALIGFGALATIFALNGQAGVALLVLPVIGAILGFLWFNFNPASIFMGDTGSLLLGYMLAAYSLQAEVAIDPALGLLVPVVVLGIPLADTGMSIVRRLSSHKAVFAPDHDHIHHRLQGRFSVRGAVYTLYTAALLLAVTAVVLSQLTLGSGLVLFAGAVAVGGSCLWNLGYLRLRGVRQMAHARRAEALSLRSLPAEERAPVEGRRPVREVEPVQQDLAA